MDELLHLHLPLENMLAMIVQILRSRHLRVLRQHQPCLKDRTKVIRCTLIFDDAFFKNTGPVNMIATIDSQIALVKCSVMCGTGSQAVAHVYPLTRGRYGPGLDMGGTQQATLSGQRTRLKPAKDAPSLTILQYLQSKAMLCQPYFPLD